MTQAPAVPLPRRCEISQKFFFDAAHTLKRTVDDAEEIAGSRRIHGHTYHAEVTVAGSADADTGMVVDLGHLRNAIQVLRPRLDHHLLDEVEGLGPGTLENLAAFIWRAMAPEFAGLSQVRVWREGIGDSCTLRAARPLSPCKAPCRTPLHEAIAANHCRV